MLDHQAAAVIPASTSGCGCILVFGFWFGTSQTTNYNKKQKTTSNITPAYLIFS
jgi:hypothetical protein